MNFTNYVFIEFMKIFSGQQCPKNGGKVKHWFTNGNVCLYVSNPLNVNDRFTWQGAKTKCRNTNAAATLLSVKSYMDVVSNVHSYMFSCLDQPSTLKLFFGGS